MIIFLLALTWAGLIVRALLSMFLMARWFLVSRAKWGVLVFFLLLCPFVSARYLTFSDNFNRADNLTVGNNWNESLRAERFSISGNKLNVTRTTGDTYIKHYLGNNPSFGGGVAWMNVSFSLLFPTRVANYGFNFQNGTFNQFSRGCGLWFPHMTGDNDLYNHYNNFANTELICSDCVSAGTTYQFSLIYNVSLQRIWVYIDGVRRGNISMFKSCQYARVLGFGVEDLAGQFLVDDVVVYNLSSIASVSSLLNVFASNTSFPLAKKSVFREGEEFRVVANYTFSNGSAISGGLCNSTMYNSSFERSALNASFSVCSSCGKSYYSQKYNVTNASMAHDAIHFYACHEELALGDLIVGLCSQSLTVPAAMLPLCPAKAFIFVNGSGCKPKGYVNFSIAYAGLANWRKLITGFSNDRFFSSRTVRMAYNSSPKWFFSNYSFEFYRHGLKNFVVNCSSAGFDRDLAGQVTIVNAPPFISLNQVITNLSAYNLSGSPKVEFSHGLWAFSSAVADDDLDYVKYDLRNASMSLKASSVRIPAVQYYNSSLFVRSGSYNFSVWANDTFHNRSYKSVVFRVNDTGLPVCSGLSNKLVNNHSWVSWDVNCSDQYFWSFNLTCGTRYKFYKTGIAAQTYNFVNSTLVNGSDLVCKYRYCDGHTSETIADMTIEKSLNRNSITIGGLELKIDAPIKNAEAIKAGDRYTFCYDLLDDKNKIFNWYVPEGCVMAPNSAYPGHVVCEAVNKWVDLAGSGAVVTPGDGLFKVDASQLKDARVCFHSVGELNCVSGTQRINVTYPVVPKLDVFTSTPQALFFFFVAFLWLFFLVGSFTFHGVSGRLIGALGLVQLFLGFFLAMKVYTAFGGLLASIIFLTAVLLMMAQLFGGKTG